MLKYILREKDLLLHFWAFDKFHTVATIPKKILLSYNYVQHNIYHTKKKTKFKN